MSEQIITPEVRAALERLLQVHRHKPLRKIYPSGKPSAVCWREDEMLVINAMLALFPPGMPEPVEMRCYLETEEEHEGTGPITHAWAGHSSTPNQNCVGLFFPLRRYEFPADRGHLEPQP